MRILTESGNKCYGYASLFSVLGCTLTGETTSQISQVSVCYYQKVMRLISLGTCFVFVVNFTALSDLEHIASNGRTICE
jgi:hypothetical protein